MSGEGAIASLKGDVVDVVGLISCGQETLEVLGEGGRRDRGHFIQAKEQRGEKNL